MLAHKQILITSVALIILLGYLLPGNTLVAQALSDIQYNFSGASPFQNLFRSPNDLDTLRPAARIEIGESENSIDQSNECTVVQTQTATNVGDYGKVFDQTIDQSSDACTNEIETD